MKHSVNRRVLALVGSAALVATTLVVAGPLASGASASCTATQFVGVRGSGESPGFGGTIASTLAAYQGASTSSVSSYALVYPAAQQPFLNKNATVADFVKSVDTGATNLRSYLQAQVSACPSQKLVIAGYSQGALVVDKALSTESSGVINRLSGVVLFGDPIFKPGASYDTGTYGNRKGVVREFLPWYADDNGLPASLNASTQSYCVSGDPVCNYGLVNLYKCYQHLSSSTCPHEQYASDGYTVQAGDYLAARSQ